MFARVQYKISSICFGPTSRCAARAAVRLGLRACVLPECSAAPTWLYQIPNLYGTGQR